MTTPIGARDEANVGPSKAVQQPARPIIWPHTPSPTAVTAPEYPYIHMIASLGASS